jgi:hypothetical protein
LVKPLSLLRNTSSSLKMRTVRVFTLPEKKKKNSEQPRTLPGPSRRVAHRPVAISCRLLGKQHVETKNQLFVRKVAESPANVKQQL